MCGDLRHRHGAGRRIGKIGRRGARRILIGSVTRWVIKSTDKPVLVVGRRSVQAG